MEKSKNTEFKKYDPDTSKPLMAMCLKGKRHAKIQERATTYSTSA